MKENLEELERAGREDSRAARRGGADARLCRGRVGRRLYGGLCFIARMRSRACTRWTRSRAARSTPSSREQKASDRPHGASARKRKAKFGHIITGSRVGSSNVAVATIRFRCRRSGAAGSDGYFAGNVFPYINHDCTVPRAMGFQENRDCREEQYRKLTGREGDGRCSKRCKRRAEEEKLLQPKVVYGYFPVQADGDDLIVYHAGGF